MDDLEKLIKYIDRAFDRQEYDATWKTETNDGISADVGYAYEWWENCMKPELQRAFSKTD